MEPNQQAHPLRKPLDQETLKRMSTEGAASASEGQASAAKYVGLSDRVDQELLTAFVEGREQEQLMEIYRRPLNDWIKHVMIPEIFEGTLTDEKDSAYEYTVDLKLPEPYDKYYAYGTAFFKANMRPSHQRRLDRFNRIYEHDYPYKIKEERDVIRLILLLNCILHDSKID